MMHNTNYQEGKGESGLKGDCKASRVLFFFLFLSDDLDQAEAKYEEAKKELENTLAELSDI